MAEVRCRLDRMGSKCPERALRELAAKLMADGQTVREAALRAIQNAWAADVDALSLLLDALPMPHQQPSSNEAPLPATRSFRRDTPVAFFGNPQPLHGTVTTRANICERGLLHHHHIHRHHRDHHR